MYSHHSTLGKGEVLHQDIQTSVLVIEELPDPPVTHRERDTPSRLKLDTLKGEEVKMNRKKTPVIMISKLQKKRSLYLKGLSWSAFFLLPLEKHKTFNFS